MTEGRSTEEPKCEICGAANHLLLAHFMALARKPPPVVCQECYSIWYEWGLIKGSQILSVRWYGSPE